MEHTSNVDTGTTITGPYMLAKLNDLQTEGKRALTLERELLKRFGAGRQYLGTVESGQNVFTPDRTYLSQPNVNHAVYGTRILLKRHSRHLYVNPRSEKVKCSRRPGSWTPDPAINRIRAMFDVNISDSNNRLINGTVHVWHNAIAVINMRHFDSILTDRGYTQGIWERRILTTVFDPDKYRSLTEHLCVYAQTPTGGVLRIFGLDNVVRCQF